MRTKVGLILIFGLSLVVAACGDSDTSVAGAPADLAPGTIVTVVDTGQPGILGGITGVGGPATEARLQSPSDLAFDADGNLYIAGRFYHQILRVDPSGILTVAAGQPQSGFSGDGGLATEAELNNASAIAVDPDGNLYISDSGNQRIRVVDADGIITTVAGTGEPGFSGDGGPATQAALINPLGLARNGSDHLAHPLQVFQVGNVHCDADPTALILVGAGFDLPHVDVDVGDGARDVGENAAPVLDLNRQAHREGARPVGSVPDDVDAPLGVVEQIKHIRASGCVHRDALPTRDVANDLLTTYRITAPSAEDHQVVESSHLDLVLAWPEHASHDRRDRRLVSLLPKLVLGHELREHLPSGYLAVADGGEKIIALL